MTGPRPITDLQMRLMKPFMQWFSWMNVLSYKWSDGLWMGKLGGHDVCLVTMKGAKSGRTIELPLMYVPYEGGVILVASMAGAPRHPQWYYNLVRYPDIEVNIRGERLRLVARLATDAEKAEVWPLCCKHYPDFERYQQRTSRDIPVFICAPAAN